MPKEILDQSMEIAISEPSFHQAKVLFDSVLRDFVGMSIPDRRNLFRREKEKVFQATQLLQNRATDEVLLRCLGRYSYISYLWRRICALIT